MTSRPKPEAASAEVSPMVSVADTKKMSTTDTIASGRNSMRNGIEKRHFAVQRVNMIDRSGFCRCFCSVHEIFLLFAELNRTVCSVHALNNCERFQLIAQITNDAAALLEALLDSDADAFHGTACLCNDGQQTL